MAELKKLGRYELRHVLGQGAMGVVYEGYDPTLSRKVAIKTILRGHALAADPAQDYSLRFMREAKAAARLSHPHIVQVYDFGVEADIAFLVMEFIAGRELRSFFERDEAFPIDEAVRIMCELLDAIGFAHQAGVIHRDIKPANVMLDSQRRVKLADFGVARIEDAFDGSQGGTMVGTPAYMSPEQVRGMRVDHRTDLFSAGTMLYQFLTGQRPFKGAGAFTVAKAIVQDEPPPPSAVADAASPLFDGIVRKALAKDPGRRFSSAREFADALRKSLQALGDAEATVPVAGARSRPKLGVPMLAAGAAVVLGVVAAAYFFIPPGSAPDKRDAQARVAPAQRAGASATSPGEGPLLSATIQSAGPRPSAPAPGTRFRDCEVCPEMIVVPAGTLLMGSPRTEDGRTAREGPQHRVTIARPFALGKFEVTFDEWDACVRAGGCSHNPSDNGWGRGRRPAIDVSWEDAQEYVAWLSRQSGRSYRLPSEAEWEHAARAGTSGAFHTGGTISPLQANYESKVSYAGGPTGLSQGKSMQVGSYAPNAFDLNDMHGNVWEWVEDCRNPSYDGAPADGSAWLSGDCSWRILRGGSWDVDPVYARSAYRYWNYASGRLVFFGLRVASDF